MNTYTKLLNKNCAYFCIECVKIEYGYENDVNV